MPKELEKNLIFFLKVHKIIILNLKIVKTGYRPGEIFLLLPISNRNDLKTMFLKKYFS